MTRGFACISLDTPKTPENVGGVMRAASAYGVAQVNIARSRTKWLGHGTNTTMGHKHIPTFTVADPLDYIPWGTEIVAVDLVDGAIPLPEFIHPERAVYVFGPEDGTLGSRITDRAQHKVMVPTRYCMNLAATVNVVLYDRAAKRSPFSEAYPVSKSSVIAARAPA